MKTSIRIACLSSLLAAAGAAPAAGTVELSWLQPERYADIGANPADRERHQEQLARHLRDLGRRLPDGRSLALEVLDVDLAGEVERRNLIELRVLRDNGDGPRLKLRWRLLAGASTLQSGESEVSELSYRSLAMPRGDLPYERQLIERWFQTTFVTP